MTTGLKMLGPNEPIPTGTWRLGLFVMDRALMEEYSEEYTRNYITSVCIQAGVSVATSTLRPLNVDLQLGGRPAIAWGGWVSNQAPNLTTAQFIYKTKLPAQFAEEVAPELAETYLNIFQGKWGSGVAKAIPRTWSTPASELQVGVWYPAVAVWAGPRPAVRNLQGLLQANGYDLFWARGSDVVRTFEPNGMLFWVYTGSKKTTPDAIRSAIGAASVVLNLAGVMDDPDVTHINDLANEGEVFLAALSDASQALAKGFSKAAGGAAGAFSLLGWLIDYGPYLALGLGGAYLGYKHWWKPRRKKLARRAA